MPAAALFDLSDFPHAELFADSAHPWEALNRLKAYMDRITEPSFHHVCLTDAVPLASPYISFNNKLRNARECIITYGDATAKANCRSSKTARSLRVPRSSWPGRYWWAGTSTLATGF
jgi:hypothetical protein